MSIVNLHTIEYIINQITRVRDKRRNFRQGGDCGAVCV